MRASLVLAAALAVGTAALADDLPQLGMGAVAGPQGAVGPSGPSGPTGPSGPAGGGGSSGGFWTYGGTCWFTQQTGTTTITLDGGVGFTLNCTGSDGGAITTTCYAGNVGAVNAQSMKIVNDAGLIISTAGSTLFVAGTVSAPFVDCLLAPLLVNLPDGGSSIDGNTPVRFAEVGVATTQSGAGSYQLGLFGLWNGIEGSPGTFPDGGTNILKQTHTVDGYGTHSGACHYFDCMYGNTDPGFQCPGTLPILTATTGADLQVFPHGMTAYQAFDYVAPMPTDGGWPVASMWAPVGDVLPGTGIQATATLYPVGSAGMVLFFSAESNTTAFVYTHGGFTWSYASGWAPTP